VTGLESGFIKRDPLAWFCSHRHLEDGTNDAYAFSYLFLYSIDIPPGSTALTLPKNEKIKIAAASVSVRGPADDAIPVMALYDDFTDRLPPVLRSGTGGREKTQ
jgi:alpha-mannosidase